MILSLFGKFIVILRPSGAPSSSHQRSRTAGDRPGFRESRGDHYSPPFRETTDGVNYRPNPNAYSRSPRRSPDTLRYYDIMNPMTLEYDGPPDVGFPIPEELRGRRYIPFTGRAPSFQELYPSSVYDRRLSNSFRERRSVYPTPEDTHLHSASRRVSTSSQRSAHAPTIVPSPSSSVHRRSGPSGRSWNRDTPPSANSLRGDSTRASSVLTDKLLPKREPEDVSLHSIRHSPQITPRTSLSDNIAPKATTSETGIAQRSDALRPSRSSLAGAISEDRNGILSVAPSFSGLPYSPNVDVNGFGTETLLDDQGADRRGDGKSTPVGQKLQGHSGSERSVTESERMIHNRANYPFSPLSPRVHSNSSVLSTTSDKLVEAPGIDPAGPMKPQSQAQSNQLLRAALSQNNVEGLSQCQDLLIVVTDASVVADSRLSAPARPDFTEGGIHPSTSSTSANSPTLRVSQAMEVDQPQMNKSASKPLSKDEARLGGKCGIN